MSRVARLLDRMSLGDNAGVLIHKPSNIFYFSGYTGEGLLVLTRSTKAIVTDFRYVEQAQQQAPGFSVHSISNDLSHAQIAANLLKDDGAARAFYEDDYLTVRDARKYQEALGKIALASLENHPEWLRRTKDESELKNMEEACRISSVAFDYICGVIKPGMTEIEIRRLLDNRLMDLGASGSSFSTIVASGPNGSLPHAIPGNRKVQAGDMITMDYGALFNGYCADMTRTISLGKPSDKMLEIYNIVLEAQMACQDALAPGKVCRDVDAISRKIIGDAGYGEYFGHGLGHSVGIDIHEEPRFNTKCTDVLEPGYVMTVEPGIYLPGIGGVRIENTCVITQTGARSLVTVPRELIVI
ncbi:MAG: aminopeptidase P family protein [Bacillota bacterium]|nr:aminopeptidase P family protein [Bacillota bacterium]